VCEAYKPTPAPPTPQPATPSPPTMAPTLPPNDKPYIRFGHTIPCAEKVDATIKQGNVTYTWSNYKFGQFSSWVEIFHNGVGEITIAEAGTSTKFVTKTIPLTPGPLVVVIKDLWPPTRPTAVETIAASYVPEPIPTDSGVRLFNLASDVKEAGLKAGGKTLVSHVKYTIGSEWAPIPVESATFTVFDQKTGKTLATTTTTPPHNPFVFTTFLIGLQNATTNSAYTTQIVPLIDAPE
jgi:hypothetical protein